MSLNEVTVCFCRKALFEGYIDCEVTNSEDACRNCWLEPFSGDVTMARTEEDNTAIAFCSNCGQSLSPDDRFCTKCGAKI